MSIVNPTPPSTPELGTTWQELNEIKDSKALPDADVKISDPIRFDVGELDTDLENGPWKLGCVPANQIESSSSDWYQIKSKPGIHIAGRSNEGGYYEIAVHSSYLPWLSSRGLICLDYNPITPIRDDILFHGSWEATKRAHACFLRNAVNAIRSTRSQGLKKCYRNVARSFGLEIPLERMILNYDILESDPEVRKHFTQCLVFLGLNLLEEYDSSHALELLAKAQDDLLQPFRKGHTDVFKAAAEKEISVETLERSELQTISLVRRLLEFSGGRTECRQYTLDQECTSSDNASLCGLLIDIFGTNRFGNFDSEQMHNALSKANVFVGDPNISTLDTVGWSVQIMRIIPVGFPKGYLNLPSQVLNGLWSGEVDLVRVHLEQTYRQLPSLRKPENNTLVLLTWSSIVQGHLPRVLSEWASSVDGVMLYQRLVKDLQNSQGTEQLALILAALLCHERLLLYTSYDTVRPINGCYLADLDALLSGKSLSNRRTVLERMCFSILRVLGTLGDEYEDMIIFLAITLDIQAPLLEPFDGLTDQYLLSRICNELNHKSAYKGVADLRSMRAMPELDKDDGIEWVMVASE